MSFRIRALVVGLLASIAAGCSPPPTTTSCTRDVDCPLGRFCQSGACTLQCAFDVDCPVSGSTCDARGHCVAPMTNMDASTADASNDSATVCRTDVQCDDGVFCNGPERCAPGTTGALANGCVAGGGNPCLAQQTCNETMRMCTTNCAVASDADGDMAIARECGGTDCDDSDPNRFPGNPEVCVLSDPTHDEDCDPETYGRRDADGDGFPDSRCCNTGPSGDRCGSDCDDTRAESAPGRPEACDHVDNNCDGHVDEGVQHTYYADTDGDGYGDPAGATMMECSAPAMFVENSTDCAPTDPNRNPSVGETRCDGLDDNCNGMTDEGLAGATCASGLPGACGPGHTTCTSAGGLSCSPDVAPSCTAGTTTPCMACDLPTVRRCDGCVYGACSLTTGGVFGNWFGSDPAWNPTGSVSGQFANNGSVSGPGSGIRLPHGTYDMYFESTSGGATYSVTGADAVLSGLGVGSATQTIRVRIDSDNCSTHLVTWRVDGVTMLYLIRLTRLAD